MPDESYDAIVIGGGNKGLATALYLAKYGGMSVGIFERSHECGGGLCTCEFAGGYSGVPHSGIHFWESYYDMIHRDFPEMEAELEFVSWRYPAGQILIEDQEPFIVYTPDVDPTGVKTLGPIAKFSEKDAEFTAKVLEIQTKLAPAFHEWVWGGPKPAGELDALEKALRDPANGVDPDWLAMSPAQWIESVYEKPELFMNELLRFHLGQGMFPDDAGMAHFLLLTLGWGRIGIPRGGPHAGPHGAIKVLAKYGAKTWTHREVANVIIENGTAKGIRLRDGTHVEARKLVLSSLSPYMLVHQLIGDDKVSSEIRQKVDALETGRTCIMWYSIALHEKPDYIAAQKNPDINSSQMGPIVLADRDKSRILKNQAYRDRREHPPNPVLWVCNYNIDGTHAPDGIDGGTYLLETYDAPARAYSGEHWIQYSKDHADWMIREWNKYAPNVTWDNVINYFPTTPWHTAARMPQYGPDGNQHAIDVTSSQIGRNRPIPELAFHRVPDIKNLYATGTAWGISQATWSQGYTCYKEIAKDLGLRKPWEEEGRAY